MEQEAEGPVIVVDQERPAVTIAFIIFASLLLGYYLIKFILGCMKCVKLMRHGPEYGEKYTVLEEKKTEFRVIHTVAYNGLLEELVDGEKVLYVTYHYGMLYKSLLQVFAVVCGIVLLIAASVPQILLKLLSKESLLYFSVATCSVGYICALIHEVLLSSWETYRVTAITNKRGIEVHIKPAALLRTASRKVVSSSPLQNLKLRDYEITLSEDNSSKATLTYVDRSNGESYFLGLVNNPKAVEELIEQSQSSDIVV